MTTDGVAALRRERAALLRFCRDLDDAEWRTDSAAAGWRVQDVVAHMGSLCHAMFGAEALKMLRSNSIERTNDALVERRRNWPPARVLSEYERWSQVVVRVTGVVARTPIARLSMPLADLGRIRVGQVAASLVFDAHTHLRYDIAPALGRPTEDTDAERMAVVLDWMMAVLGNQLEAASPAWLDRSVALDLSGPGGGRWTFGPPGELAVQISGRATEFPEWGTRRAPWRDRDLTISGDTDYGARFLDLVKVI